MRLADRMRIALESSAPDDELRVWMWIEFVHGGEVQSVEALAQFGGEVLGRAIRSGRLTTAGTVISTASLATSKASRPVRRKAVAEEPPKRKRVKPKKKAKPKATRFDKLEGRARFAAAFEHPNARGAKDVRNEAAEWAWRRYNAARKDKTGRPLPDSQKTRSLPHMRELAKFVLEERLAMDDFLEWAYKRTRWQKTAFPATSMVAGAWIREEWFNEEDHAPEHAGHTYAKAVDKGLRPKLVDAGIAGAAELTDDELEFIAEEAIVCREHPEHYTPDPELHEFVQWVADHEKDT